MEMPGYYPSAKLCRYHLPTEHENPTQAQFFERLKTSVLGLHYDAVNRTGWIYFPRAYNCDMHGCIELFKAIDPHVLRIHTFSGDTADTQYRLLPSGWTAFLPCHCNPHGDL